MVVYWTSIVDKGMDNMVALTHEQAFFDDQVSEVRFDQCVVHSIDMYCTLGQKYWAAARPLDYK